MVGAFPLELRNLRSRRVKWKMEVLDAQIVYIELLEFLERVVDAKLVVGIARHREMKFYLFHGAIIPQIPNFGGRGSHFSWGMR